MFVLRHTYREKFEEAFEDTKGVNTIRKSKKNRQHNGQMKKYKRTNNDLQNTWSKRSSNTNPTKNRWWTQVLRKGKQFLLY